MYSKQKCILCPSAEEMRGLAACPKNPKIHLFKQNLWIQVKKMDFWISQGFFWIFLDSSKGCLDFWVSKSKIQKNSRKKMDFCKNPTFTCIFLDFLEKSIFFLEFFWIFDIRIGKINLFPRFFLDFCKNPSFPLGFLPFFEKSIFSLGFFTFFEKSIFFLTLGNPKIHLFDLNPKILFEKMDFWIFG